MSKAFISEIYASVQGEGPFTGEKQIFIRLAGCPLRCDYCDTPDSLTVEGHPSMTTEETLSKVVSLGEKEKINVVSVTGGEPLAQVSFLGRLFPALKEKGFKIYLETAGVHPEALKKVLLWCDVIAMDIKLPSATGKEYWDEHRKFLEIGKDKAFVKIVIEKKSKEDEVRQAAALVSEVAPDIVFVLQKATPQPPSIQAPESLLLDSCTQWVRQKVQDVRVMEQSHKKWGVR